MRRLKQLKRENWGGYYLIPTSDVSEDGSYLIFGVSPLHCYPCGMILIDGVEHVLLYIFWDKCSSELFPDTLGKRQEMFDFAGTDGDAIMASPLVQLALSGGAVPDPTIAMFSEFCPSTAALIMGDLQEGLSAHEILFKRLGIMVNQYAGETWEEVLSENPTWLSQTVVVDDEGNEHTIDNITKPTFRGN